MVFTRRGKDVGCSLRTEAERQVEKEEVRRKGPPYN